MHQTVNKRIVTLAVPIIGLALALSACGGANESQATVRVAYFPNIAHAPAFVGLARGDFQTTLGPEVKIATRVLNAGPQVIGGLFAGEIDIAYVGPNPAINGYVRSNGEALRIVAGSATDGASFVVAERSGIRTAADLKGKRLATPGIGNSQDISLRAYLLQNGLKAKDQGGSVQVIPLKNADILNLFRQGDLDGAWVPEPWVTRLVLEAGGRIFIDERDLWPVAQTIDVVRTSFLQRRPGLVERWLQGHIASMRWIQQQPQEAQAVVNKELARILGKGLPEQVLRESWPHLTFDPAIPADAIRDAAERARTVGYLRGSAIALDRLIAQGPIGPAPRAAAALRGAIR